MKLLERRKKKGSPQLSPKKPRLKKLSKASIKFIVLTDLAEIQNFFFKLNSNETEFRVFEENFSFFRELEKEPWDVVIIDSGVWSYLPSETRKRLFDFRQNQNKQGYPKFFYLETEKEISENKLKKNLIYLDKEAMNETILTSTKHIKILFEKILFWSLGEEHLLYAVQDIRNEIHFAALESLILYLKKIDYPFPLLAGESDEKKKLEEIFESVRHSNASLLISGEKGSLGNELGFLIHSWHYSVGRLFAEIDLSRLPKPPFSARDIKWSGIKTVLLKKLEKISPENLITWKSLLEDAELDKTKIIWVIESQSTQHISKVRKTLNTPEFIQIPSLSQRILDIPAIIQVFMKLMPLENEVDLSKSVLSNLLRQPWPANYEQLKQQILSWITPLKRKIKIADLPAFMVTQDKGWHETIHSLPFPGEGISIEKLEKEIMERALKETRFSVAKSARLLGIGRKAFLYRMQKYKITGKKEGIQNIEMESSI